MSSVKQNKKTTIYDLAKLAGVSASAVSAILNGNWQKRRISAQLAEKVARLAEQHHYSVNQQASLLRREKSKIIGMLVPKYDNRYFGSIVEHFEQLARERHLFPIITCTRRDPMLEIEATKAMLSYQVNCLVATGATDPDKISLLCQNAGVRSLNLDLPGTLAPSVISDNYAGAKALTQRILQKCQDKYSVVNPLVFIGGHANEHNTEERLRGFRDAHQDWGLRVSEQSLFVCGYAAEKAEHALRQLKNPQTLLNGGWFVNSTISLEGVMRWLADMQGEGLARPVIGCFDWEPFVNLLDKDIEMVRQDVPMMLNKIFELIDHPSDDHQLIEIPPIIVK